MKYLAFVKDHERALAEGARAAEMPAYAAGGYSVWCAAKVQAWWRMLTGGGAAARGRRRQGRWNYTLQRFRVYHIASQQIQYVCARLPGTAIKLNPKQLRQLKGMLRASRFARFAWKSFLRERWEVFQEASGPDAAAAACGAGPSPGALPPPQRRKPASWTTPEDKGAAALQGLWRSVASRRIFKYYRDLIQFRLAGDPRRLLRTINPREAALFDRATGIQVRFRLAGCAFPPTLVYKVFLLNPLCDVGAFAPRDYAAAKPTEPHLRHNKAAAGTVRGARGPLSVHEEHTRLGQIRVGGTYFGTKVAGLGPEGTSGWYHRIENNGWRPVTQRQVTEAGKGDRGEAPPFGAVAAAEQAAEEGRMAFHYSRVRRREDKEALRRTKKREWLAAMYKDGLAKERAPGELGKPPQAGRGSGGGGGAEGPLGDHGCRDDRGRAGDGSGALADPALADPTGLLDDMEDVLAWSAELNFDSYVANWATLATSGTSGSDHHDPLKPAQRYRRPAPHEPEPDWAALNEQLRK